MFDNVVQKLSSLASFDVFGKITSVNSHSILTFGLEDFVTIGSRCEIINSCGKTMLAEVVSINTDGVKLIPFTSTDAIGIDSKVRVVTKNLCVRPDESWLGRLIDSFGNPIDGKGLLKDGEKECLLNNSPPSAEKRSNVSEVIDSGVRAINCFTTLFYGQRIGLFAGSGVGKSVLLSMLARYSKADVKIIGLIGERGREVKEFIRNFGSDEFKNAIIVVSTSDQPALSRKQAANLVMTISEYFRDKGKKVLCFIDSITRFALAQREIGLSSGEVAFIRGYTPSVFIELPKLLERAGAGEGDGSITGIFSVLIEGDDTEEPLSDVLRSILDGHIVLDRKIAESGRYPAIDILRSVSRIMHERLSKEQLELVKKIKRILALYNDMQEIINMGLYKSGSNEKTDLAIRLYPKIEEFLSLYAFSYRNNSFINLS